MGSGIMPGDIGDTLGCRRNDAMCMGYVVGISRTITKNGGFNQQNLWLSYEVWVMRTVLMGILSIKGGSHATNNGLN